MDTKCYYYRGSNAKTREIEGETWWFLIDICDILEIEDYQTVVRWLELIGADVITTDTPSEQNAFLIPEIAMLDLLASIPSGKAKHLKQWITETIIPDRKRTAHLFDDCDAWLTALAALKARRATQNPTHTEGA